MRRVCVVGAGHGGSAVAAYLSLKGHHVSLLKTSSAIHNTHFEKISENNQITLIRNGITKTAKIDCVTKVFEEAMKDSEIVIVFVQTNFQEEIAKKISGLLSNQVVVLEPGYLGTSYFLKESGGIREVSYVEAQSSPFNCRIIEPGVVRVNSENIRNPVGIFPKERKRKTFESLEELELKFVCLDSLFEAALHNPNLIVHTIGAFMSIPRIEYTNGDYWMYREVFTPTVWNLLEGLDNEKMDVMEKLGCKRMPYVEASKFRNSADDSVDAKEDFFYWALNKSSKGPSSPDSRYLTEDVPQGLVLLESLGQHFGIETPVCSSLITLSSVALNRDFRREGRTIDNIGLCEFQKIVADNACV